MANNAESSAKAMAGSSWDNFKMTSNGTSGDIKKSAAQIRTKVSEESKIFSNSSIFDGGTKKSANK